MLSTQNSEVYVNLYVQAGTQEIFQPSEQVSGRMNGTNGSLGDFTGRLGRPGEGGVILSPAHSAA